MAYGFIPGETGHGNVRMLVPAGVKRLAADIREANKPVPREGDLALLEWPTSDRGYAMRLSFLDRKSELFRRALALFNAAVDNGTTVGEGASGYQLIFRLPSARRRMMSVRRNVFARPEFRDREAVTL